MTADEILQAAERRVAEIDALFITLTAERAKLQAMVGRAQTAKVLPLTPIAPQPIWPWPPVPEIQPYTPFFPIDDGRYTWAKIEVAAEPVLMDGFRGNFEVVSIRGDAGKTYLTLS